MYFACNVKKKKTIFFSHAFEVTNYIFLKYTKFNNKDDYINPFNTIYSW